MNTMKSVLSYSLDFPHSVPMFQIKPKMQMKMKIEIAFRRNFEWVQWGLIDASCVSNGGIKTHREDGPATKLEARTGFRKNTSYGYYINGEMEDRKHD